MDKFKRRRLSLLISLILIAVIGGSVAFTFRGEFRSSIEQLQGNDYPGPGTSEVEFIVNGGDSGEVIAKRLVDAGVVKNFRATYKYILDTNPTFYPGVFTLRLQMDSKSAIKALSDPNSASLERTTIKEGLRANVVFKVLSESTGIKFSEFNALFQEPGVFSLDPKLKNIEGYLFPATYTFAPGATAKQILQQMIDRMLMELKSLDISADKAHEVITLASIIQKEARLTEDFYKVSRTFKNRLEDGMHLQSDATVSYGVNGNTVSTSSADRANKNGYNTYLYAGLPIGPISAPGSVALDAALHPAKGDWLYFCTINLETGETLFSSTYAEHELAVAKWISWMKDHPEYE
ncbi:MAG: endolytic transglycosylase MltG [Actinobacteria bacterium]|uniref:Unannotated protein n=1 Tax=freshwater metagenome TaxID=449393 RepID=A0A6J6HJ73_9ZZZZ|nr:endolytic transglycosylase MltG [Actinomycetota bacterium]